MKNYASLPPAWLGCRSRFMGFAPSAAHGTIIPTCRVVSMAALACVKDIEGGLQRRGDSAPVMFLA